MRIEKGKFNMNKRIFIFTLLAIISLTIPSISFARLYNVNTGRFQTMDAFDGVQETPLSLNKYLYCQGNPINMTDPSGHDGDLGSLSLSLSISSGLSSAYNAGVLTAGNALIHTITGVENNLTANQILGGFYADTAISLGIGFAIGAVADIAGDVVYGSDGGMEIEVNATTAEASQNFSKSASTTEDLMVAANQAVKTQGNGSGPIYGTKVHGIFEKSVNAARPDLKTEVSYFNGQQVSRGTPGSVRVDVVEGPVNAPTAIFDLKTGGAKLTAARIQQIQKNIPGGNSVPVIMIKPPLQ
jgi:hypothetical protein